MSSFRVFLTNLRKFPMLFLLQLLVTTTVLVPKRMMLSHRPFDRFLEVTTIFLANSDFRTGADTSGYLSMKSRTTAVTILSFPYICSLNLYIEFISVEFFIVFNICWLIYGVNLRINNRFIFDESVEAAF